MLHHGQAAMERGFSENNKVLNVNPWSKHCFLKILKNAGVFAVLSLFFLKATESGRKMAKAKVVQKNGNNHRLETKD